jgi:cyanate permease
MAEVPKQQDRPGWWSVELYALGAVLHGFDVMSSGFQAAIPWWALGSVLAIVGWHWNRIKPLLGSHFEETERK